MPQKPPRPYPGAPSVDRVSSAGPAGAPRPVDPAAPVKPAERAAPVERAAKVDPAAPVSATEAAQAVARAGRAELVSRLAGRLRGGEITVAQAVEELIEDTVQGSLGGAQEARASEQLRAALRAYVEQDPFLTARLRRLEKKR